MRDCVTFHKTGRVPLRSYIIIATDFPKLVPIIIILLGLYYISMWGTFIQLRNKGPRRPHYAGPPSEGGGGAFSRI